MRDFSFLDRIEAAARSGEPTAGVAAEDLQALYQFLCSARQLPISVSPGRADPFPHPWSTKSRRLENPGALDPSRAWQVTVAPGVINDDPFPAIIYRAHGDPRGWEAPPETKGTLVDRDLWDDPLDPPWLLAMAPPPGAKNAGDFTLRPRANWPGYFKHEAAGELADAELWRAHVILTALPLRSSALDPQLPPPTLRRFRVYVVPKLPAIPAAGAGGWVELATLWLVRRDRTDASADELLVEQQEFFPLWSAIVQPESGLVAALDELSADVGQGELNQLLADLLRDSVSEAVQSAAFVSFWTC